MAGSWVCDWRRVVKAAGYSAAGFRAAWQHEAAFRQLVLMLALLLPPGLYMADALALRVLLVAAGALVIVVELLNSAVEAAVDRIGTEHHPLSGRAKDLGSAAQLVSTAAFLLLWLTLCYRFFSG